MSETRHNYGGEFLAALTCFVLAAAAGVVMRFVGAGFALPGHVDFSNLRRAHSHLMLFGWVTPALFTFIAARATTSGAVRFAIRATLLLGLASFAPFLLWGYEAASFGEARVPVSVIVSTLNMFAWYGFAVLYLRMRPELRERSGSTAVTFWDAAMVLMVVGTAGAWARGAFIGLGVDDPFLTKGAVEFFLSTFVDGFLLLGVLGFAAPRRSAPLAATIALAVSVEFLALLPSNVVAPGLRTFGAIGVIVGGGAVVALGVMLVRRLPLEGAFVVLLGGGKVLLASSAFSDWAVAAGLRIPYLHLALLGVVTLLLVRIAARLWPSMVGVRGFPPAVLIALVGLLPTTALWPGALSREVGLLFTAFASAGPLIVAVGVLRASRRAVQPDDPVAPLAPLEPVFPALASDDTQQR